MIKEILYSYKWLIALAILLSVASAVAGVAIITLIEAQVSALSDNTGGELKSVVLFGVAIVAVVVFGIYSQYILTKLSAIVVFDVRKIVVRKLMGTSYENIEKIGGHRVYATLTDDVSSISEGLMLVPQFINSFATVVLCFAYLLYSSWQLFLVILTMIAVIVVVAYGLLIYGMIRQSKLRELDDELFAGFRDLVDGGKEISVNSTRKAYVHDKILLPVFEQIKKKTVGAELVFIALSSWSSALIFCVIGVIVFGSQYLFPDMPVSVVVSFMLIVFYLIDPLESIVDSVDELGEAIVAYKKIESLELADSDTYSHQEDASNRIDENWKRIHLQNIGYAYEQETGYQFNIGPINIDIERGQILFLVGGNGSGKSTFAKLLCGLYTPTTGSILVDDVLVKKEVNGTSYTDLFSVIFSDFYLFKQVLTENGELAIDSAIDTHIQRMGLSKSVSAKDGVLTSVNLSQGQKKRLALVISFIENSSICIYDEWAADQDPEFRKLFYTTILPELKAQGKTLIVITHDEKYFHLCDRVLKFDNGQISNK